jgi:large subunit ribosomal protein L23
MAKTSYDIILRPLITEQSMEAIDLQKYAFEVQPTANKIEIKKAIEEIFGVKVQKVTTLNMKGKIKRNGRYPEGPRKHWKKAVVRLTPESKTIEFFEGMV